MIARSLVWTPHAKERARSVITKDGRHMTFTPQGTRQAEADLAKQWVGAPIEGPIAVGLAMWNDHIDLTIGHCPDPESSKLRRGDIDNYLKLILDALNGVAWVDDRQIAAISARKM